MTPTRGSRTTRAGQGQPSLFDSTVDREVLLTPAELATRLGE